MNKIITLSSIFAGILNFSLSSQAFDMETIHERKSQYNNVYKCSEDVTEKYWTYGNSENVFEAVSLYCGDSKNAQWVLLGGYGISGNYEFITEFYQNPQGEGKYKIKAFDLELEDQLIRDSKKDNYYYLPKALIGFNCYLVDDGWICENYSDIYENFILITRGKYALNSYNKYYQYSDRLFDYFIFAEIQLGDYFLYPPIFDEDLSDRADQFCKAHGYFGADAYIESTEYIAAICVDISENYCYTPDVYRMVVYSLSHDEIFKSSSSPNQESKYPNPLYTFEAVLDAVTYQIRTTGGSLNNDPTIQFWTSLSVATNNEIFYYDKAYYYYGSLGKGC
jgi:hypothetical protein